MAHPRIASRGAAARALLRVRKLALWLQATHDEQQAAVEGLVKDASLRAAPARGRARLDA